MKNMQDYIIKSELRYWRYYCDMCQCDRGYLRSGAKLCRSCAAKARGRSNKVIRASAEDNWKKNSKEVYHSTDS
jgi:hypothetical protein